MPAHRSGRIDGRIAGSKRQRSLRAFGVTHAQSQAVLMCFSATASFVLSGILAGVGAASLAKTSLPSHRMLAAIPLVFAVRTLGVTLALSLAVATLVKVGALTSTWCFFAAALSGVVFCRRGARGAIGLRPHRSSRASAHSLTTNGGALPAVMMPSRQRRIRRCDGPELGPDCLAHLAQGSRRPRRHQLGGVDGDGDSACSGVFGFGSSGIEAGGLPDAGARFFTGLGGVIGGLGPSRGGAVTGIVVSCGSCVVGASLRSGP